MATIAGNAQTTPQRKCRRMPSSTDRTSDCRGSSTGWTYSPSVHRNRHRRRADAIGRRTDLRPEPDPHAPGCLAPARRKDLAHPHVANSRGRASRRLDLQRQQPWRGVHSDLAAVQQLTALRALGRRCVVVDRCLDLPLARRRIGRLRTA